MKKLLIICLIGFQISIGKAQENDSTSTVSFYLNADVVNRYIWRGLMFSPNVNIQPYAGVTYKGFSLSTWASYGLSDRYAEIDFVASYTIKNLTLYVSDYFTEIEDSLGAHKHFNLSKVSSPHAFEASAAYKVSDRFPLTLTAATYFYGNDKKLNGDNYYSTYFEIAYPLTWSEYSFNFFLGGTPSEGLYAEKAAVVNAGFTATKNVKITDKFSLPLSISLVSNPHAEDVFLVFKIIL